MSTLSEIRKIIKKKSRKHISPTCYRYHFLPVAKFAKILSQKLGIEDLELIEIAALLHDIGSLEGDDEHHHLIGQEYAQEILKKLGYPKEKIEIVKKCIFSHRASQNIKRLSLEEQCITCADALAHIDQSTSLLYHAFVGKRMNLPQGRKWVKEKLKKSWKKLIPEAKELIKDKYFSLLKNL